MLLEVFQMVFAKIKDKNMLNVIVSVYSRLEKIVNAI